MSNQTRLLDKLKAKLESFEDQKSLNEWIKENSQESFGVRSGCWSHTYLLKGLPYVLKVARHKDRPVKGIYSSIEGENSIFVKRFLAYFNLGTTKTGQPFAFQEFCEKSGEYIDNPKEREKLTKLANIARKLLEKEGEDGKITSLNAWGQETGDLDVNNCGLRDGKLVIFDW